MAKGTFGRGSLCYAVLSGNRFPGVVTGPKEGKGWPVQFEDEQHDFFGNLIIGLVNGYFSKIETRVVPTERELREARKPIVRCERKEETNENPNQQPTLF